MEWIAGYEALIAWLAGASTLMFVGGVVLVPLLVARMPADYFLTPDPADADDDWTGWSAVWRIAVLLVRNACGALLLLLGLVLLVLPGQGVLTILVAISLMTFPGKRRLELRIARVPAVLAAIQWIRARAGQPPVQLPDRDGDD